MVRTRLTSSLVSRAHLGVSQNGTSLRTVTRLTSLGSSSGENSFRKTGAAGTVPALHRSFTEMIPDE
jgi:hypothetical protein